MRIVTNANKMVRLQCRCGRTIFNLDGRCNYCGKSNSTAVIRYRAYRLALNAIINVERGGTCVPAQMLADLRAEYPEAFERVGAMAG